MEALDVYTMVWRDAFITAISAMEVTFDFIYFQKQFRYRTLTVETTDEAMWPMRKPNATPTRPTRTPFRTSTREMLIIRYDPGTLVYPDKVFANISDSLTEKVVAINDPFHFLLTLIDPDSELLNCDPTDERERNVYTSFLTMPTTPYAALVPEPESIPKPSNKATLKQERSRVLNKAS